MRVADKVVVITGGGSGIGRSLAERFVKENAKHVVVADIDGDAATAVAAGIGGVGVQVDVGNEDEIVKLIDDTEARVGPIDLFCSNAGVLLGYGLDTPDDVWKRIMDINVMAHLYAARHLVPRMVGRGGGYLLNTASAAGLLTQIGSVTYSVTKHAAVALAEWISITYGEQGIKVSVLCPQAVRTAMTTRNRGDGEPRRTGGGVASVDGMLEPEQVADAVIEALEAERFLILPHPEVAEYFRRKATDYDRWLNGMRRLQQKFRPSPSG
jgi:NAD(P)-dependent dehydrogenase (short-subunit alcohol dehydrogenase family)